MSDHSTPPSSQRTGVTASKSLPALEVVARHLAYCEYSPSGLIWLEPTGMRTPPGSQAGSITAAGYYQLGLFGQRYQAHRLVWLLCTGDDPAGMDIDHIDGPGNNFANLRLSTHANNMANRCVRSRPKNPHGSLYKGVRENRGASTWRAVIGRGPDYVGSFPTERDAARAYNLAAIERWGEKSRLNSLSFPGHTWSYNAYISGEAPEGDVI